MAGGDSILRASTPRSLPREQARLRRPVFPKLKTFGRFGHASKNRSLESPKSWPQVQGVQSRLVFDAFPARHRTTRGDGVYGVLSVAFARVKFFAREAAEDVRNIIVKG